MTIQESSGEVNKGDKQKQGKVCPSLNLPRLMSANRTCCDQAESAVLHRLGHCSRPVQFCGVCGDIVLTKSLLLPIVIGLRDLWSAESKP